MAQHAELRPSAMDVVLGTASRALREARSMRTRRSGSAHWDDGQGGGVVTGPRAGEYGGIGRITGDGMLEPLFDLDPIKQAVDQANGKSDQAIRQAEQVRTQAEAGVAEAKSDAAAATAKAEQVRKDTETMVRAVRDSVDAAESKAQNASEKADKLAGSITDVTATVNGHSSQLKELSTKVEGAVSANGETVKSVTELKQTVTGLSATVAQNSKTATDALSKATSVEATANGLKTQVTQNSKTASDALSKATSVEQTANGITATLSKDYQTAKDSDAKYSTKAELKATSNELSSSLSSVRQMADGAVTSASKAQQTADGISANLSKNYATKADNDATYATQTSLKATSDSLAASINSTAKTAQGAVDKATNLEANLNGFKTTVADTYQAKGIGDEIVENGIPNPDRPNKFCLEIVDGVFQRTFPGKENHVDYGPSEILHQIGPHRTIRYAIDVRLVSGKDTVSESDSINAIGTDVGWFAINVKLKDLVDGEWHSYEAYQDLGNAVVTRVYMSSYVGSEGAKVLQFRHVSVKDVTSEYKTYSTKSSLTQTADSIKASVAENARKADAAMSKASSVEQTASGLSTRISEVAKKGDQTVQSLNTLSADVTGFKQTVQQTYATGARVSRLESGLDGFRSTVSQTYSPKSETADLAASTVRRYRLSLSGAAAWHKIGFWHPIGQGSVAAIHVYTGYGTNGREDQNSEFTIMLKKGWTGSSNNHRSDYGVNLIRQRNAADVQVKAFSYHPGGQDPETTPVDIWVYQPWGYGGGHYDVSYDGSWSNQTTVQTAAPVEDSTHTLQSSVGYETLSNTSYVDQTSRSVSLGVVEEYKNGQHGSALATQSDITAAKDSITSTVSKHYATQSDVDATYARKTELKQTENSLTLKVQSASDTADSAKTNASNAQSRVGVLETMVRADGNGVRVGKTTNGQYTGYSALVNASGSFDVLDRNNKVVARFSSSGVAIDTGNGIFSINGKEWSAVATGVVNGPYGVRINWVRFGKIILVNGVASVTGPFHNATNLSVYEKWPSALAPADQGTILFNGNNQQNFQIRVGRNGHMELSGSGQPGYWYSYCGVWNVA